jgi:lysophospholipase L1-like esterase
VSIKPSPSRVDLLPAIREANARIRDDLAKMPQAEFIDVYTTMLDTDGRPRAELFGPDRLHMNAAGYALWRREISNRLP